MSKKSIWKYVFDELVDGDFASDVIEWLKERPIIKDIPDQLFDEAVSKWRKYNSVREIKLNGEKLRFFEYRLALFRLGFPDEFEFLTLDTYFKEGRLLAKK